MRPAISMRAELDPEFAQWLRKLPAQVQLRFQRRAMRQALSIFKRIATPLYRQHRTNLPRKHLDQSLAVVTRRYKSPRGVTLWGALGFRRGRVRSIGGVAPKADRIYSNEWAGWRAHFLERGFTATGSLRNGRQDDLGRLMQRISVRARVQRGEGKSLAARDAGYQGSSTCLRSTPPAGTPLRRPSRTPWPTSSRPAASASAACRSRSTRPR